jgi:hypothetical protein
VSTDLSLEVGVLLGASTGERAGATIDVSPGTRAPKAYVVPVVMPVDYEGIIVVSFVATTKLSGESVALSNPRQTVASVGDSMILNCPLRGVSIDTSDEQECRNTIANRSSELSGITETFYPCESLPVHQNRNPPGDSPPDSNSVEVEDCVVCTITIPRRDFLRVIRRAKQRARFEVDISPDAPPVVRVIRTISELVAVNITRGTRVSVLDLGTVNGVTFDLIGQVVVAAGNVEDALTLLESQLENARYVTIGSADSSRRLRISFVGASAE